MSWLFEPLAYPFMREALLVGTAVAVVCAVLSCFLVLRGWSLMGDAISHAVLPGIVLAWMLKLPLSAGAFASGLLCALGTGWIRRHSRLKEDTVMAVVFTGLFATGLVLFSRVTTELHLDHILFGNILGIPPAEQKQTLWLAAGVLSVVLALRRDLMLLCFDPAQARVLGLRVEALHYLLLALLAMTVVVALKAVGIILVIAMLVGPGAVGYLLTDSFDRMLVAASVTAAAATWTGVIASYHVGAATGACIVLAQAAFFLVALVFAPKHGVWGQRRRRMTLATSTAAAAA